MKNCIHCSRQLISCGWNYYYHPMLVDHYQRHKDAAYQCLDAGKNLKIA